MTDLHTDVGSGRTTALVRSRVLSVLLALFLALASAGCGDQGEPVDQEGPNETGNEEPVDALETP